MRYLIEQFCVSLAYSECLPHAEVGNRKACNIRKPETFNSTQCAAEFPDAYAVTYWTHGWRKIMRGFVYGVVAVSQLHMSISSADAVQQTDLKLQFLGVEVNC